MNSLKRAFILFIPCLLFAQLSSVAYGQELIRFKGVAHHNNGDVAYIEHHRWYINGNQVTSLDTLYMDAKGTPIGKMDTHLRDNPHLPEFVFSDYTQDYLVRFEQNQDGWVATQRRGQQSEMINLGETFSTGTTTGQGLHFYIKDHFEKLIDDGNKVVNYLIPARGKAYRFNIRVHSINKDVVHFKVEITNWFMRLFAPHFELYYDRQTQHLLRYHGPSIFKNDEGRTVTIRYDYS